MTRLTIAAMFALAAGMAFAADGAPRPGPAPDPSVAACRLLTPADLASALGEPVTIFETQAGARGVSACHWRGSRKGAVASVQHFPEGSAGIEGAQPAPLELFEATMTAVRAQFGGQGELTPLPGVGDRAYMSVFRENPTDAHMVYLLRNGASVTLSTFGVGDRPAPVLAKRVAERM